MPPGMPAGGLDWVTIMSSTRINRTAVSAADWIAWQFDRPELEGGVVQAFRRDRSESPTCLLRLRGLAPSATYEVTDLDGGDPLRVTGTQVMRDGLAVELAVRPGAAVRLYRKIK